MDIQAWHAWLREEPRAREAVPRTASLLPAARRREAALHLFFRVSFALFSFVREKSWLVETGSERRIKENPTEERKAHMRRDKKFPFSYS